MALMYSISKMIKPEASVSFYRIAPGANGASNTRALNRLAQAAARPVYSGVGMTVFTKLHAECVSMSGYRACGECLPCRADRADSENVDKVIAGLVRHYGCVEAGSSYVHVFRGPSSKDDECRARKARDYAVKTLREMGYKVSADGDTGRGAVFAPKRPFRVPGKTAA